MSTPNPTRQFVIVPHRPRAKVLLVLLALGWLASLYLVFEVSRRYAAPHYEQTRTDLANARAELATLQERTERLRQRNAVIKRSDEVSRTANQSICRKPWPSATSELSDAARRRGILRTPRGWQRAAPGAGGAQPGAASGDDGSLALHCHA
jgi:hypothetical protein